MYVNPWGMTPKEKNRFQEYYLEVYKAYENEDWVYIRQLRDELTIEQWVDLWHHLASYTRSTIKKGFTALNVDLSQ
jgi:hypothetical protein